MLNEHQVAEYLNLSVASVRRWRLFRKGPKFLKIGSAVRYRREDVDAWLISCPGLR
jgi:excisionase family DNA binding protein